MGTKTLKRIIFTGTFILAGLSGGLIGCGNREEAEESELENRGALLEIGSKDNVTTEIENGESVYEEKKEEDDISEETDVQYPMIVPLSSAERIDLALVSEENYCIFNGEKYGFITEDGEEIAPCIYDMAYPFSEGLACVSKEGKYGYIDLEGKIALPFDYDRATPFVEGVAYFTAGDTYGFMDKTGMPVFHFECDSVSSFQEGLAYFSKDGRYGYIDQNGQVVIEPIFDDAGYFKEGLAKVRKEGKYGVINREGALVVATEYDSISISSSFIITRSDGKYACFDKTGKVLLEQSDYITTSGNYICFEEEGKQGFMDEKGSILIEPLYDWIFSLIPEQDLLLVREGEQYGIVDLQGEIKIPAAYTQIYYDNYVDRTKGGMLLLTDTDGKVECIDAANFTDKIPCNYDSIDWLDENRAVVTQDGLSGIIDREGNLIEPIEYDIIRAFTDGAVWMQKGAKTWFYNSSGKMIEDITGHYDDISLKGNCYQIEKNGKYGFLNELGEEVIRPVYDYVLDYKVYGSDYVYILTKYNNDVRDSIIKTGESERADLSAVLLQNEITPRSGLYQEFTKSGNISLSDGSESGHTANQEDLKAYKKTYKLYNLNDSGELLLFFKAEPYRNINFPMSYSGFYAIRDEQLVEMITGFECGGSLRGDYACLWYDRETSQVLPGTNGVWGGFGGYAALGVVYDWKDGELTRISSFGWINQEIGNYSKEELENAELFYDGENKPYTKETITQAKSAQQYSVNGVPVAIKEYQAVSDRYQILFYVE